MRLVPPLAAACVALTGCDGMTRAVLRVDPAAVNAPPSTDARIEEALRSVLAPPAWTCRPG